MGDFKMMRLAILAAAIGAMGALAVPAAAAPVAVVEDIAGPSAGVQAFDFIDEGRVIQLQASNTLVLSYLDSCWRESIVGGTVRVGRDQSSVEGGQVGREQVDCHGGRMRLTAQQAQRSGGIPVRGAPAPPPPYESFGQSPIILMGAPGRLVIERVGQPGSIADINVQARDLNRGAYDLQRGGIVLQRDTTYRAKVGRREVVFRISPQARPGSVPVVSRLIQFQ
jgi:hypothetical protein